jgi:penicillin-binding protein 1A
MLRKFLRWILVVITAIIAGFAIFVIAVNFEVFGHLYSKKELKDFRNQTATRVLSSDDQLIGKFFVKNRTNINYNQLPIHLIEALVATEDARYFEHEGVDSRSLIRVLFKTILLGQKKLWWWLYHYPTIIKKHVWPKKLWASHHVGK